MNCPDEVAAVVTEILELGLLAARAAAWEGDGDRAAALVDHLHNLPALLREYAPELLEHYLEVERPALCDSQTSAAQHFELLWARLQPFVEAKAGVATNAGSGSI